MLMQRIALSSVVVAVVALAACSGGEDDSGDASAGDTVRVGSFEPRWIDPAMVEDTEGISVARLICEGLTTVGEDDDAVPASAESWEVSDDGTVYTFELRPDQTFSDGSPVDAAAFAHGWQRLADPDLLAYRADLGSGIVGWNEVAFEGSESGAVGDEEISGVRAVGPTTLEVELIEPDGFFPLRVSQVQFCPAPPESEIEPDEPVGNGPFRMAGPWERGRRIVLEPNDEYRDAADRPRIEFVIYDDVDTAYREFRQGNLDVVELPAEERAEAEREGDTILTEESVGLTVMGLPAGPPFDRPEVREALRSSIDVAAISERVLNGTAVAARGFIPPNLPEYAGDTCAACDEDAAAAGDAGLDGDEPLGLSFPEDLGLDELAEAISNDWRANLGIEVELDPLNEDEFFERLDNGEFEGPFIPLAWSWEIPSSYDVIAPLFGPDLGFVAEPDPELDALLADARTASDQQAAFEDLRAADQRASAGLQVLPLVFENVTYVVRPGLDSLSLDFQGRLRLEDLTAG